MTVRYPERAGDDPLKRTPVLAAVTILYDCAPVKNCELSNVVVPVTVSNAYPEAPPELAALTVVPLALSLRVIEPHERTSAYLLCIGGESTYQVLTAELKMRPRIVALAGAVVVSTGWGSPSPNVYRPPRTPR